RRAGSEGAAIVRGNEYEFGIIEKKVGLDQAALLARVPVLIVTHGADGSTIALREPPAGSSASIEVPPAKVEASELGPTGVGDAYPAGLLAARLAGAPWDLAGRTRTPAALHALPPL